MSAHVWQDVPAPKKLDDGTYEPKWHSVALFFNLAAADQPTDYQDTSATAVRTWLDVGGAPAQPTVSEFMTNYYGTLSYGQFAFGIATPMRNGQPIIEELDAPEGGTDDFAAIIRLLVERNPDAIWRTAGSLERDGHRFIPSVVLVHRYWGHAWADGGWTQTVDGVDYEIGRINHVPYNLTFVGATSDVSPPGVPANRVRVFWRTLAHEYGHNFLDMGDLYGPSGCTGYWDLLGDSGTAGRMPEVASVHKAAVGWIKYRREINGPHVEELSLALRPYSSSGDAFKVVPDPGGNPHEYFILEYRARTADALWVPDRGLTEQGLLIIHVNDRLGLPPTWLNHDCPYLDPEFADFSDNGTSLWTGWDRLEGVLFTGAPGRDAFTPDTRPSSALYGPRQSGLHVTDIRVTDSRLTFNLSIDRTARPARPGVVVARTPGWLCSSDDRGVAGRFSATGSALGAEIAMRNDRSLAVLRLEQGQWFVHDRQHLDAHGWPLDRPQGHVVGDFDADGRDEIFARIAGNPSRIAVLDYRSGGFTPVADTTGKVETWELPPVADSVAARLEGDRHDIVQFAGTKAAVLQLAGDHFHAAAIHDGHIDGWNLRAIDQRTPGRVSQRAADELVIRSDRWLGLLAWDASNHRLRLRSIQQDNVDGWNLHAGDRHVVGDFDGDGLDEVYIRSQRWAGVLKWNGTGFEALWIEQGVQHWLGDQKPGNEPARLTLDSDDRFQAARLFPDRAAILHRAGTTLSMLSWEGGAMRVRRQCQSPFHGRWTLASDDRLVVADFHGTGPDPNVAGKDFIQDGIADVFLHAERGTAMVGANHIPDTSYPGGVQDQFNLAWVSDRSLLADR